MKDALLYIERHPLGGPKKGFQGDAFYTAENPPYGAVFTAYLKEKMKTKKEKRQEAEKDAAKKNQTLPYPSNDELRAEAEEAKPEVYFVVYDESGAPIRRVDGEHGCGVSAGGVGFAISGGAGAQAFDDGEEDFPDAADRDHWCLRGIIPCGCFRRWAAR